MFLQFACPRNIEPSVTKLLEKIGGFNLIRVDPHHSHESTEIIIGVNMNECHFSYMVSTPTCQTNKNVVFAKLDSLVKTRFEEVPAI